MDVLASDMLDCFCSLFLVTDSLSLSLFPIPVKSDKPVINPFLFGGNLREGMRTSVLCSIISGDSPLTITWFKDHELLQNVHPDVEILTLGEFTSTLRIPSVRREHAGNYTCLAKSFKATTSFSAQMVVQCMSRHHLSLSPFSFSSLCLTDPYFIAHFFHDAATGVPCPGALLVSRRVCRAVVLSPAAAGKSFQGYERSE